MTRTIEQAGRADQERIKRLLTECGGPTEDLVGAWHESFLVARESSAVVGVVGLEIRGKLGLVRSLATSPGHRGRGIASALLETAEERARAAGIRSIYGLTTTAEVFFTKRGYESIDRTEMPEAIRNMAEFRPSAQRRRPACERDSSEARSARPSQRSELCRSRLRTRRIAWFPASLKPWATKSRPSALATSSPSTRTFPVAVAASVDLGCPICA